MKTLLRFGIALLVLAAVAAPADARKKGSSTAPGRYVDWKDEVDELEIVATFKLSDYETVSVESFDTEGTPLPDRDDNTYEPVLTVLADPAGPFTQGLARGLGDRIDLSRGGGGERAIVIHARVDSMDPGSQAARYWAGFGAGAARTRLVGEAVDAETGAVLFRFTQERRSGVGAFGGDYVKLMNRNLFAIGEDVALVLEAF